MVIFSNWQMTGCWVVERLYGSTRENGAIVNESLRGSVRSGWLVGIDQETLKDR